MGKGDSGACDLCSYAVSGRNSRGLLWLHSLAQHPAAVPRAAASHRAERLARGHLAMACDVCDWSSTKASRFGFWKHHLAHHAAGSPGLDAARRDLARRHGERLRRSKRPGTCDDCGKSAPSHFDLVKHIHGVHQGLGWGGESHKKVVCELCSKTLMRKKALFRHLRAKHGSFSASKRGKSKRVTEPKTTEDAKNVEKIQETEGNHPQASQEKSHFDVKCF